MALEVLQWLYSFAVLMSWWRRGEASTVQVVGNHRGCVPLILRPYRDHAMLSRKEDNHQSEDLATCL